MADDVKTKEPNQASKGEVATFDPPRLPYHPLIEERFGVDKGQWQVLIEAVWPSAKTTQAVCLALAYCKNRKLDPLKKPIHIVPIWDAARGREIETIWPGIGELRTTAFRTGLYAGADPTEFGPDVTSEFTDKVKNKLNQKWEDKTAKVTHPEWARVTIYRMVMGERVAFSGPRVHWLSIYQRRGRSKLPNDMWEKRPSDQLEKCAEAAALRRAFPEEIGEWMSVDEAPSAEEGSGAKDVTPATPRPRRADYEMFPESQPLAELSEEEKPKAELPWELLDNDGVISAFATPEETTNSFVKSIEGCRDAKSVQGLLESNLQMLAKLPEDLERRCNEVVSEAMDKLK